MSFGRSSLRANALNTRLTQVSLIALVAAAGAISAHAADAPAQPAAAPPAPAPAASAADQAFNLETLVVTARRREENLERVPAAITAFSQKTLTEKAIANVFDLDRAVPGLQVS